MTAAWLALAAPAGATGMTPSQDASGTPLTVFENPDQNYRIDLTGAGYRLVDGSILYPDASFAALRVGPHAVALVIAEEVTGGMDSAQYAEAVQQAMEGRLADNGSATFRGHRDLGTRDNGSLSAARKVFYADVGSEAITYVVSAIVEGDMAYQLLTFSTTATESEIVAEADRLLEGFSIPDAAPRHRSAKTAPRSVADYRSETFGYRVRARGSQWMDWAALEDSVAAADFGALALDGYGMLVEPLCWRGEPPPANALYRLALRQFGEDYPSDFITAEREVRKGEATGRLFAGTDVIEGEEYLYHIAMLATEDCAYLFAAWGLNSDAKVGERLDDLWRHFDVLGDATAAEGRFTLPAERSRNALALNLLGLQEFGVKRYRDAFRLFDEANTLEPADTAYAVNAVQALAELSEYQEASDWLAARLAPVADDAGVRSWDAWLAFKTGEHDKARRIYGELFAAGYRDDNDFRAYATVLADAGDWEELDRIFQEYSAGGASAELKLFESELLGRRGEYERALAKLDELDKGRGFNPDLAYARIAIHEQMDNPAEVLRLADLLIANNYRSLESYYYKGGAQYRLQSYRDARASFEEALKYAPGNSSVREYLEAIDAMLGEGDVTLISQPIEPVPLPRSLEKAFAESAPARDNSGYGSEYLSRIKGISAIESDTVVTTWYQKIHIFDDNGVESFSTLQFDFDAAAEQLFVNALRVRNADGELIAEGNLQSYFITSDEDGYEASSERTAHLPVPNLAPGMTIEAIVSKRTTVEEDTLPLELHYLATDRPIHHSAVFVAGDAGELRYVSNEVPEPERDDGALVWRLENPVAFRWEPLLPHHDQILPWVQFGSVGSSWAVVGNEYLAEIADKLAADGVTDRAVRLVDSVEDQARRIEILSAYVQDEITYKAIEFGRRAYVPKTARETLRDRYGDCKDHAVLLHVLLQSVGIESSLALVNLHQAVNPDLPNTDQFNHMIVAVPTDSGRLFIDATDKDLRLGRLVPRSLRGNYALILGDAPVLEQIPAYASVTDSGLEIERVVELLDATTLAVRETARLAGYQAADLRGQLRAIEAPDMQSSIQRWVAGRYSDAEVTDYYVENVFEADDDLVVEIRYQLPIHDDGKFELPGFVETYYLQYDRVADRRFPFEFYYPLRVSARTSVRVPPGVELASGAGRPDAGESRFGNWRRAVDVAADAWEIRFDYEAAGERFPADQYREFADFQRAAIRGVELPVVLR